MFKKWVRKGIGALVLVGILVALVAGTALAQEENPEGFQGRERGPHAPIRRLAEATGLTAEEVVDELQNGKTPAEILTENGADVDAFVDEVLADIEARLDEAVANGVMDQARADEILAQAAERVPEMLDETYEDLPDRGGKGKRFGRGIIGQLAETIGQTVEDVLAQLKDGKTPAEVLTENGADPDAFVDQLLADIEARLDEAVANGVMDQARADEILAQAAERVPEMLDQTFEPPGEGDGPRQGGGAFRQGPGGGQPPIGPGVPDQSI